LPKLNPGLELANTFGVEICFCPQNLKNMMIGFEQLCRTI